MVLLICGTISVILFAFSIVASALFRKDLRKSVRALSAGVFITIFVALAPCHVGGNGYSFGVNLFDTICVMITQSSLTNSLETISQYSSSLVEAYRIYLIVLYVLGPLSIASATLSFVKGFGKIAYQLKSLANVSYIFSSVNERSLAVCKSVRAKNPKAVMLFAIEGGTDGIEENILSQIDELGGIVVRQSVKDVRHTLKHKRIYCLLDKDASNNIGLGLAVNEKYKNYKSACCNVELLIYSTDEMSQIIFYNTTHHVTIHLFREEEIIANDLMFNCPLYGGVVDGKLNVLIVGGGKIGYEILKKIIWSGCLGKNVKTQINVVDVNAKTVEKRLKKECPALFEECKLDLQFLNANVTDNSFTEVLDKIDKPTYIVAALGNDRINTETCIYLRRHYGVTNGYPKIHMTTNSEDYADKLRLLKAYDWSVEQDRSFSNRIETAQDYDIKGFGSYESAYRHLNPAEFSLGLLALSCHVVKMNLSVNGDGGYRNAEESVQQFVNSLTYSYNQIAFTKNNADQLALSIGYVLYALGYAEKCSDYLKQVRIRLNLKSVYDIPFALYIDSKYDFAGELQSNIDYLVELITERYNLFMYTQGWTKLPLNEIENKSTRDQLRLKYARLGDYDVEALEKLINECSDNPKNYRQNDIDEILRLPVILKVYNEIKDCK